MGGGMTIDGQSAQGAGLGHVLQTLAEVSVLDLYVIAAP
jgi:hypothetical protein